MKAGRLRRTVQGDVEQRIGGLAPDGVILLSGQFMAGEVNQGQAVFTVAGHGGTRVWITRHILRWILAPWRRPPLRQLAIVSRNSANDV